MEFKVLSVLKKYMSDEEFTAFSKAEDFEKSLQTDITKYITANTPNQAELVKAAQLTAHEEVIKGLGIESVKTIDELKSHIEVVGNTTTDKEKELIRVTKERDELKASYETEVETRTNLENESKLSKQMGTIKSLGVNDPDELEFLHYKFNKQVTEEKDFDTVVAEYAKDNGVKTTIKYVKDDFSGGGGNVVDIGAAFKAKREAQGHKTK